MPKESPPKGVPSESVGNPDGAPLVVVTPEKLEAVKDQLATNIITAETELEKVLKEQKARGEISAASESTMQALMEQLKTLNSNMEVVKKLEERMNLAPLRVERKWWEDLLPW